MVVKGITLWKQKWKKGFRDKVVKSGLKMLETEEKSESGRSMLSVLFVREFSK